MKKINDWVIKTFGLRGSWSWAKKQMLNGAIIKRKATTGTYKIAIDNDKNRLLVATWGHLDQNPVWERCPHSLLDEDAVIKYFLTDSKEIIQHMIHGVIYGKWTFVKRGENFGIKLVKVLPGIHKCILRIAEKDIFGHESK